MFAGLRYDEPRLCKSQQDNAAATGEGDIWYCGEWEKERKRKSGKERRESEIENLEKEIVAKRFKRENESAIE